MKKLGPRTDGLISILPVDKSGGLGGLTIERMVAYCFRTSLAIVLCLAGFRCGMASDYLWPVEGHRALTSTFGEFRYSHFHAGIDISTNGVNGVPLRSVEDGYVYRLKTSPSGYGRAIYIRLDDGNIAVYGHLSRFTRPIEERVREEQHRVLDYAVDFNPQAGEFTVKRGEVIGYSGDSGNVVPHLHFELRTSENQPINPLAHYGLIPSDSTGPRITAVAINPIGIGSTVDEGWETKVYRTEWNKLQGVYSIPQPIQVWGECGVEVSAHDLSSRGYQTGVYSIELAVNGQVLSTLRYDSLTYDEYRRNYLVVNRELYLKKREPFQRSYEAEKNVLPFYHVMQGTSGILSSFSSGDPGSLRPGTNDVRIVVEDHAHKRCSLFFQLSVEQPFSALERQVASDTLGASTHDNKPGQSGMRVSFFEDFIVVEATVNEPISLLPLCLIQQAGGEEEEIPLRLRQPNTLVGRHRLVPHRDGVGTIRLTSPPHSKQKWEETREFIIQTVTPAKGGAVTSDDGVVSITFEPGSVFRTLFPLVLRQTSVTSPSFLKPESASYYFEPLEATFLGEGNLAFRLPQLSSKVQQIALFYRDKEDWHYVGNQKHDQMGWVTASVPHFAEYVLFRDIVDPVISIVFPGSGSSFKSLPKPISARIDEKGTGIDSRKTSMFLDGNKVPAEYLSKKRLLVYDPFYPLEPGEHTVSVVAVDMVGNRAEKHVTFFVTD